eukprot:g26083.t1
MLGSALLAPPLGAWADQTDRRWVVTLGVSAQAVAVLGSTLVLFLALQVRQRCRERGSYLALTPCGVSGE